MGEAERNIGAEDELESSVIDPGDQNAEVVASLRSRVQLYSSVPPLDAGSSTLRVILEVDVVSHQESFGVGGDRSWMW